MLASTSSRLLLPSRLLDEDVKEYYFSENRVSVVLRAEGLCNLSAVITVGILYSLQICKWQDVPAERATLALRWCCQLVLREGEREERVLLDILLHGWFSLARGILATRLALSYAI